MTIGAVILDESFVHTWKAEVLPARPTILPARHFVYPLQAEEVERGALEVLIMPAAYQGATMQASRTPTVQAEQEVSGHNFSRAETSSQKDGALAPERGLADNVSGKHEVSGHDFSRAAEAPRRLGALAPAVNIPLLATCALGFRDPAVPTGLWSTPNPDEICAVAGGYAYMIDTTKPERFTMIPYRPVLEVRAAVDAGLLFFVGHHSILAWGRDGQVWESEKLSDEGVTITAIEGSVLRGSGWQLMTDTETAFAIELRSGKRINLGS